MGLSAEIRKVAVNQPQEDPTVLAQFVAEMFSKDEFIDLLAEDIKHAQRWQVLVTEKESFSSLHEAASVPAPAVGMASLFRSRFSLGDGAGTMIEWGKATVADHTARIAMLEAMVAGVQATITRHRKAIAIIEAAGATCLEEALALKIVT